MDTLSLSMAKSYTDEKVEALSSIGKYLALWNCTTGLPTTNPSTMPYTYATGMYYIVSAVNTTAYTHSITISGTASESGMHPGTYSVTFSIINSTTTAYSTIADIANAIGDENSVSATGTLHTTDGSGDLAIVSVIKWVEQGTTYIALRDSTEQKVGLTQTTATITDTVTGTVNYKPSDTSYTGTASTATESNTVAVGDMYRYDGTTWELLKFSAVLNGYVKTSQITHETWTFTLDDESTVTKEVVLWQ